MKNKLEILAKKISQQTGFKIKRKIYQAYSYYLNDFRNIIFSGEHKSRDAILKIYNEERITDEPLAMRFYSKINKSKILITPKLYEYKILDPKSGWLIMEKLPIQSFIKSPLEDSQRKEFLKLFLIYRQTLPLLNPNKLTLAENLPANLFHFYRIGKWLKMADEKQAYEKFEILKPKEIFYRLEKATKLLNQEFKKRKMVYCHGHFKPKEIAKVKDEFYLTDFGHMKMYPEGYELSFMIWADYLIPADWHMTYRQWSRGVFSWLNDLEPIAKKLKIKNYQKLIRASLIERILGTIMADVASTNRPRREKIERINLLYKLFDEIT